MFENNTMNVCGKWTLNYLSVAIESVSMLRVPFLVLICFLVLVSIIATLGNGLIMVTIYKKTNLHKPSYLLIACMAVIDLMLSLTYYPFFAVRIVWIFQKDVDSICRTDFSYLMIGLFFIGVSYIMSLLISIDRYLAIALRTRYRTIVTKRRVLWAVVLSWIFILVLLILNRYIRGIFRHWRLVSGILGVLILTATIVFYTKAFISLRRYTLQVHNQQPVAVQNTYNFNAAKYKKSLNTMVMVLSWLLFCCIPLLSAQHLLAETDATPSSVIFDYTTVVVFSVNSCTNPVIYFVRFTEIRNACREIVIGLVGH